MFISSKYKYSFCSSLRDYLFNLSFVFLLSFLLILFITNSLSAYTSDRSQQEQQYENSNVDQLFGVSELLLLTIALIMISVSVINMSKYLKTLPTVKHWQVYLLLYLFIFGILIWIGIDTTRKMYPDYDLNILHRFYVSTFVITVFPLLMVLSISQILFIGRPEKKVFVYMSGAMGGLAAALALLINQSIYIFIPQDYDPSGGFGLWSIIFFVLIVPFIEEFCKLTGMKLIHTRLSFPKEYAFLLALALGFGFASYENWIYFTVNSNILQETGWFSYILLRTFMASMAHVGFIWVITYLYLEGESKVGYLLGVFSHALYNYAVIQNIDFAIAVSSVLLIIYLYSLLKTNRQLIKVIKRRRS